MMRVSARDLFALADAITALEDDSNTEFDVLWRQKVAEELKQVYEKFLRMYREAARSGAKARL